MLPTLRAEWSRDCAVLLPFACCPVAVCSPAILVVVAHALLSLVVLLCPVLCTATVANETTQSSEQRIDIYINIYVCRYGRTELLLLKFRDAEYTSTISSTELEEDARKNSGEVGMRGQKSLISLVV